MLGRGDVGKVYLVEEKVKISQRCRYEVLPIAHARVCRIGSGEQAAVRHEGVEETRHDRQAQGEARSDR